MDQLTKSGQPEPMRCRNCNAPLNENDETLDQDISCPTCGSRVPRSGPRGGKTKCVRETIGRFELLEEVGSGQFGVVYRAHDTALKRMVAVKVPRRHELTQHTRNMFKREGNAAAALNHPNIVRLYEVFDEGDQIYIASEFIYGDNLKTFLAGEKFESTTQVAQFMLAAVDAVQHAHKRGIIHRDLKPGNILVDANKQPHLTDFGLAKIESYDSTMTTYKGQLVGTLAYMSPEQAGGEIHALTPVSDVFSLGVILYEILTGERPFDGESLAEIIDKIRQAEPVKPRDINGEIPRDLESICLMALSKEKHKRYQTAEEFADDLRRFLAGKPTKARPVTRVDLAARWLSKNLTIAAVCLVALLSTAAGALTTIRGQASKFPEVNLTTNPPGAEIRLFPLDPLTGEPMDDKVIRTTGKTPLSFRAPPGDYLVVARLDRRFHEVYRQVPKDPNQSSDVFPHRHWLPDSSGNLSLPAIDIPSNDVANGMVPMSGTNGFFIDSHEVTVDEFRRTFRGEFPGNLAPSHDSGNLPMTDTLFDYAIMYAEMNGKRLPTAAEFEFAATNGGTTAFPWGDDPKPISSMTAAAEFDRTISSPPVFGLCSFGGEFTSTSHVIGEIPNVGQRTRLLLNITQFDQRTVSGMAADGMSSLRRTTVPRSLVAKQVSFRCVRSKTPRW